MHPDDDTPPIFTSKAYHEASVFQVENLLREGRRQRSRTERPVPAVCMLDPDGDVVRHLRSIGDGEVHDGWSCYHSELWVTHTDGIEIGIVACAVGASYAVLVAEQLAASGCSLVVSITSAGRIVALGEPPYFVIIERARRDEGTSLHYVAPSEWSLLDVDVVCVAHVTNTLAVDGDDFEKGEADGTHRILRLAAAIARRLGHG